MMTHFFDKEKIEIQDEEQVWLEGIIGYNLETIFNQILSSHSKNLISTLNFQSLFVSLSNNNDKTTTRNKETYRVILMTVFFVFCDKKKSENTLMKCKKTSTTIFCMTRRRKYPKKTHLYA